jgi:transposase
MAGKFNGVTDEQWDVVKQFFPQLPEKRTRGMPPASFRAVFNTIAYIAITGSRWCDIPEGPQWGKRTTSHRWLARWAKDGTWDKLKAHLLGAAELANTIDWNSASVDGSFSPRKGRGRKC